MVTLKAKRVMALEQRQQSRSGSGVVIIKPGEQPEDAARRIGLRSLSGLLALPEVMELEIWTKVARQQQSQLIQDHMFEG